MIRPEDEDLLGLFSAPARRRRSSAVSQILRKISDDLKDGSAEWDLRGTQDRYHIRIASDLETRRAAYALAFRVYQACGYASGADGLIVNAFDAAAGTFTLLAQDDTGTDVATVTLNFDSPTGLPGDETYSDELDGLRAQGRKVVEVTRFAISEAHQHSKMLLVHLFNLLYIFAHRVRGFDDLVIECTPRHAQFYSRLLLMRQVGPERPCPRVQGTVGVLLRLDLLDAENRIRTVGKSPSLQRTLYPHFYSWIEEGAAAEFLAQTHKPMSSDETEYFGLAAACAAGQ